MFDYLNKLNLCVSHTLVVKLMKNLGVDHDIDVQKWKEDVEIAIKRHVCIIIIGLKQRFL